MCSGIQLHLKQIEDIPHAHIFFSPSAQGVGNSKYIKPHRLFAQSTIMFQIQCFRTSLGHPMKTKLYENGCQAPLHGNINHFRAVKCVQVTLWLFWQTAGMLEEWSAGVKDMETLHIFPHYQRGAETPHFPICANSSDIQYQCLVHFCEILNWTRLASQCKSVKGPLGQSVMDIEHVNEIWHNYCWINYERNVMYNIILWWMCVCVCIDRGTYCGVLSCPLCVCVHICVSIVSIVCMCAHMWVCVHDCHSAVPTNRLMSLHYHWLIWMIYLKQRTVIALKRPSSALHLALEPIFADAQTSTG